MKAKVLMIIVVVLMATVTFGINDANNPYVCEQEVFEGPFKAILRVVDVDGRQYEGNKIGVEWLVSPTA